MIRKLFTIALAIHIVILTGGFALSKHYCADQLDEVTFSLLEGEKTCGCGNDMHAGCCSTTTEQFQLEDDYFASFSDIDFQHIVLPVLYVIHYITLEEEDSPQTSFSDTPPPYYTLSIFLLTRSLRL